MNFTRRIVSTLTRNTCLRCTGLLTVLLLVNCNNHPGAEKMLPHTPKDRVFLAFEKQMNQLNKAGKYESVIIESKKELAKAKSAGAKKNIAFLYANLASAYIARGRQDSAITSYKACEEYADASGELKLKVTTQVALSSIYYDAGKPDSVNV